MGDGDQRRVKGCTGRSSGRCPAGRVATSHDSARRIRRRTRRARRLRAVVVSGERAESSARIGVRAAGLDRLSCGLVPAGCSRGRTRWPLALKRASIRSISRGGGSCETRLRGGCTSWPLRTKGRRFWPGGALATFSGEKTGRSPQDKRIVQSAGSADDVWWGSVNIPATEPELPRLTPPGHRVPVRPADRLCGRRLRRLGPGLPGEGPGDLCAGLSCPLHAQPADPADARRAGAVRRARAA